MSEIRDAAALKAERDNANSEQVARMDAQIEALCDAWRRDIRTHQDGCPAEFSNCVPDDCACGLTEKRESEIKKIKESDHKPNVPDLRFQPAEWPAQETIGETIRRGTVLCPRCKSILLVDTKGDVTQCARCGDAAFVHWNLFVQAR